MKLWQSRTAWGLLLVSMGALLLLESLQILSLGVVWAFFFVAAGLIFGYTFIKDRSAWWALIPTLALFGIGVLAVLDALAPRIGDLLGPSIFLGGIGLSFCFIYLSTRTEQWWAIIPAGVLISLSIALVVEPLIAEDIFAALFLLGIAGTFVLVYLLPNPEGRMSWALIPATVLAIVSVIVLSATTSYANYIWPVLLIVIGLYILLRNITRSE